MSISVKPEYIPWNNENWVRIRHFGVNGELKMEQVVRNNRTSQGALFVKSKLYGTNTATSQATAIALTGTIFAPAAGATNLIGELSTYGFQRANGAIQNFVAPTALNGTFAIDVYKQFQHTGTGVTQGIGMAGLWTEVGSALGTLYALATFTQGPATLQLAELLDVTWTVAQ